MRLREAVVVDVAERSVGDEASSIALLITHPIVLRIIRIIPMIDGLIISLQILNKISLNLWLTHWCLIRTHRK